MNNGRLIIEVYESGELQKFEYTPCFIDDCFSRKNSCISLKDLVKQGFNSIKRKNVKSTKQEAILQKLQDAGFDKIDVVFHPEEDDVEQYVELANVKLSTFTDSDARNGEDNGKDIIMFEKYSFTDGNEVTSLKDGQRLTMVYSSSNETNDGFTFEDDEDDKPIRQISLNITYLCV